MSSPTIRQVQEFEFSMRKHACEKMDDGMDWWTALLDAMADKDLKDDFRENIAAHVATSGNRSVTAPGITNVAASSGAQGAGAGRGSKREAPPPPPPHAEA